MRKSVGSRWRWTPPGRGRSASRREIPPFGRYDNQWGRQVPPSLEVRHPRHAVAVVLSPGRAFCPERWVETQRSRATRRCQNHYQGGRFGSGRDIGHRLWLGVRSLGSSRPPPSVELWSEDPHYRLVVIPAI